MSTIRKAAVASTPAAKPVIASVPKLEFFDVDASSPGWTAPAPQFKPRDRTELHLPGANAAAVKLHPGPPSAAPVLAHLLAKAAGARDTAQLLAQFPGLSASLNAFAPRAQSATPADQEKVALAALRHFAVKSGSPLTPALRQTLGGSNEAIASAYARDLGFQGVRREGDQWLLLGAGAAPMPLKAPSGSVADLGKAINEQRFANTAATPPLAPVDVLKPKFGLDEAHLAVHLASLAYQPKEVVKAQLENWGFDTSTFKWVENKATDTQGFVVADRKGNVFPVFRGTESGGDWETNGKTALLHPSWRGPADFEAHVGFTRALDSVWPEMKAGIEAAQKKAGPNAKVMFSGHSLGGALTQLAAVRAGVEGVVKTENVSIYTIGSPRVGNQRFKDTLEGMYPRAFRIANYEEGAVDRQDLVTQVPPKKLGFHHAGQMIRLGSDKITVIDRSSTAAELSDPALDPQDPGNAELENLEGPALARRMQELMGGANVAVTSADDLANASGFQVASILAHSSGVYLDRISQHALARH